MAVQAPGLSRRFRTAALFGEDFDAPAVPEPEVIAPAPAVSAVEIASARADAFAEGHAAGQRAAAAEGAAALAEAAARLGAEIAPLLEELRAEAAAAAGALARLLLDTLAVMFPALSARHGAAEARALVRALLPGLALEPEIVVRAHPELVPALTEEVARTLPDEPTRVRVLADPAMAAGDVRVRWRGGSAARDAAALWTEIAAALGPSGLLSAQTREVAHVE